MPVILKINDTGRSEIAQFLRGALKQGNCLTYPMIDAWVADAQASLERGEQSAIVWVHARDSVSNTLNGFKVSNSGLSEILVQEELNPINELNLINEVDAFHLLHSFWPYRYSEAACSSIFYQESKGVEKMDRDYFMEDDICKTYREMSCLEIMRHLEIWDEILNDTDLRELDNMRHDCDKEEYLIKYHGEAIRDYLEDKSEFVGDGQTYHFVFAKFGKTF